MYQNGHSLTCKWYKYHQKAVYGAR